MSGSEQTNTGTSERRPVKLALSFKTQLGELTARTEFETRMPPVAQSVALRDDSNKSPGERGSIDGQRNVPAHDVEAPATLADSHAQLEQDAANFYAKAVATVVEKLRVLRDQGADFLRADKHFPQPLRADTYTGEINAKYRNAIAQLGVDRSHLGRDMEYRQKEFDQLDKEFRNFRKRSLAHQEEAPRDPKAIDRRQFFLILGFCLLIEMIFNGSIFSTAVEGGALQGAMIAIALSGINVLGGFFLGYLGFRFSLFRNYWMPLAIIFSLVLGAFLFCLNVVMAHERDAMIAAVRDGAEAKSIGEAISAALANPLDLNDITGLLLLIAGVLTVLIAAWEGYQGWDDPLPEFRERHQKWAAGKLRIEMITDLARTLQREVYYDPLRDSLNEVRADVNTIYDFERKKVDALREVGRMVRGYFGDTRAGLSNLGTDLIRVVTEYRSENRKARAARRKAKPGFFGWIRNLFLSEDEKKLARVELQIETEAPAYFNLPLDKDREFPMPDASHFQIPAWPEALLREAEQVLNANEVERAKVLAEIDRLISRLHDDLWEGEDKTNNRFNEQGVAAERREAGSAH